MLDLAGLWAGPVQKVFLKEPKLSETGDCELADFFFPASFLLLLLKKRILGIVPGNTSRMRQISQTRSGFIKRKEERTLPK